MDTSGSGMKIPEDWIGKGVVVLSHATGSTFSPEGGYPLVGELYSGELRVVNEFGLSLRLVLDEEGEGAFYPGGDTFFPWGAVLRISLAIS